MKTPLGFILGNEAFYSEALRLFDRRKKKGSNQWLREGDFDFPSPVEVIKNYEERHKIDIKEVDFNTQRGTQIRGEILVLLKDKAGLTYKEIKEIPMFRKMSLGSIGGLYHYYKKKMEKC